jgi:hypothetical protein
MPLFATRPARVFRWHQRWPELRDKRRFYDHPGTILPLHGELLAALCHLYST